MRPVVGENNSSIDEEAEHVQPTKQMIHTVPQRVHEKQPIFNKFSSGDESKRISVKLDSSPEETSVPLPVIDEQKKGGRRKRTSRKPSSKSERPSSTPSVGNGSAKNRSSSAKNPVDVRTKRLQER